MQGQGSSNSNLEEQGYVKEILNDWVSSDGVGVRKYDDLTAIGMSSLEIRGQDGC